MTPPSDGPSLITATDSFRLMPPTTANEELQTLRAHLDAIDGIETTGRSGDAAAEG